MHDPEIDGLTPKVEIGALVKNYVKRWTDEMTQDVLVCSFWVGRRQAAKLLYAIRIRRNLLEHLSVVVVGSEIYICAVVCLSRPKINRA